MANIVTIFLEMGSENGNNFKRINRDQNYMILGFLDLAIISYD